MYLPTPDNWHVWQPSMAPTTSSKTKVLKSGVTEAASLSFNLFNDCDLSEKLAAVLYGRRANVVLDTNYCSNIRRANFRALWPDVNAQE